MLLARTLTGLKLLWDIIYTGKVVILYPFI